MIEINPNKEWKWNVLSEKAWSSRDKAKLVKLNSTKVGASILTDNGNYFTGCNAQHKFRSHDIHAEICVIGKMYSECNDKIKNILIVSERAFLTPCGSCLDWIKQFSNLDTKIGIQSKRKGIVKVFDLQELIPFYPK